MDPSKDEYISVILEAFAGGLKKISVVFERWSRHNELQQYFEVLEEWDDIVGDNWDPADTPKLDPITWISENSLHTQQTAIISSNQFATVDFDAFPATISGYISLAVIEN